VKTAWLVRLITDQRDHALALQSAEAGDRTLCDINKRRQASDPLKRAEGQTVALGNLLKAVRRIAGEELSASEFASLLAEERSQWQRLHQLHQHRTPPLRDWLAYAEGGLQALHDLADRVSAEASRPDDPPSS